MRIQYIQQFSTVSFLFFVGSFFAPLFPGSSLPLWAFPLACISFVLLNIFWKKPKALRYVTAFIPMTPLLFLTKGALLFYFLFLYGVLIYLADASSGRPQDYLTTQFFFRRGFLLSLAMMIFSLPFASSGLFEKLLPFQLLYLFSSIFSLRTLRHQDLTSNRNTELALSTMSMAFLVVATLLTTVSYFRQGLYFVFNKIYGLFIFILTIFAYWMFLLLQKIWDLLSPSFQGKKVPIPEKPPQEEFFPPGTDPSALSPLGILILEILLAIVVVLILIGLARFIHHHSSQKSNDNLNSVSQKKSFIFRDTSIRKKRPFPLFGKNHREKVRFYFYKWMKLSSPSKFLFRPEDTAQDMILKGKGFYDQDSLDSLYALYISARYSPHDVSPDDVKQAKELWKVFDR